jgi:uncharacterized protein
MAQVEATSHDMESGITPGLFAPDPDIMTGSTAKMVLEHNPIEPSWILAGSPFARLANHSKSSDDASCTAVWDCTAGEFRWYFHWDETVFILEGDVRVTSASGNVVILKAGDIAYFRAGTWSTWKIDRYVRKVAFLRRPMPRLFVVARALVRRLRGQTPEQSGF